MRSTTGALALVLVAAALAGCGDDNICFVGSTPVLTLDRSVAIADLRPGDAVLSWDLARDRPVARRVARIVEAEATELYAIHTKDRVIDGVTESHPIYVVDKRAYIRVEDLELGDRLWDDHGQPTRITEIRRWKTTSPIPVYTLTVEGPEHNYFTSGLLAKNKTDSGMPQCPSDRSLSLCGQWCLVSVCCLLDETEQEIADRSRAPIAQCERTSDAEAACTNGCEAMLDDAEDRSGAEACLSCLLEQSAQVCAVDPQDSSCPCEPAWRAKEQVTWDVRNDYTCWAGTEARPMNTCGYEAGAEQVTARLTPSPNGSFDYEQLATIRSIDPIEIDLSATTRLTVELHSLSTPSAIVVGATVAVDLQGYDGILRTWSLRISDPSGQQDLLRHWATDALPEGVQAGIALRSAPTPSCESSFSNCPHRLPLDLVVQIHAAQTQLGQGESQSFMGYRVHNERTAMYFNTALCSDAGDNERYEGWLLAE